MEQGNSEGVIQKVENPESLGGTKKKNTATNNDRSAQGKTIDRPNSFGVVSFQIYGNGGNHRETLAKGKESPYGNQGNRYLALVCGDDDSDIIDDDKSITLLITHERIIIRSIGVRNSVCKFSLFLCGFLLRANYCRLIVVVFFFIVVFLFVVVVIETKSRCRVCQSN